jgi:hypothetical protein
MYNIDNNKLKIDNDTEIVFDYPIRECVEIEDMLIIHLNYIDKVIPIDQNVFGVSLMDKKISWQIAKRQYPDGGYLNKRCPFVGISIRDKKLWLQNWCSIRVLVNPVTGEVIKEEMTK